MLIREPFGWGSLARRDGLAITGWPAVRPTTSIRGDFRMYVRRRTLLMREQPRVGGLTWLPAWRLALAAPVAYFVCYADAT